jgi:hypothetical protein
MTRIALIVAALAALMPAACSAAQTTGEVTMAGKEIEAKIVKAGRPRLFFQAEELARLRQEIKTTKADEWARLKESVDHALDQDPPENRPIEGDPTRPGTPNDEMLWQRVFGYHIPGLALVALLDPDPKYLAATRKWAMKPGEYPLWGAGVFEGTDLAAAHELYGISIAYDWLYDRWSPEDRERLKQILAEHGKVMYEAAAQINDRGWWHDTWRQNHAWCNYGALGVTAVALAGDVPGVGEWLAKSEWAYQHIFAELPEEGAYEEGVPYWGYGMESLVRYIAAVRPYVATDFYASPYLRKTHLFRLYLAGPSIGSIANFGDGPTRDWHSISPLMYRLAAEYRSPAAEWLAEALPPRKDQDTRMYDLLWHDPTLKPEAPEKMPLWHAFKQTGFAGARTSWGEDAMTLHVRSGKADVSHSHLDVNNFLLNAGGEWLLRDYGYGEVGPGYFGKEVDYFSNDTIGHNCLVIGGKNQRKDDASVGVITDAQEENGVVWFRSDATKCYQDAESVVREWALIRPHAGTGKWGYLVVRDRAKVAADATFEFVLQPGGPVTVTEVQVTSAPTGGSSSGRCTGDRFVIRGEKAWLAGRVLAPSGVVVSVEAGVGDHINVKEPLTLRIAAAASAKEVEFVVVFVPLADGESAPEIAALGGGKSGARIEDERIVFDPDGRRAPHRE